MFFSADKYPSGVPSHSEQKPYRRHLTSAIGSPCYSWNTPDTFLPRGLDTCCFPVVRRLHQVSAQPIHHLPQVSTHLSPSQWGFSCPPLLKSQPTPYLIFSSPTPLLFPFFFQAIIITDRLCIQQFCLLCVSSPWCKPHESRNSFGGGRSGSFTAITPASRTMPGT